MIDNVFVKTLPLLSFLWTCTDAFTSWLEGRLLPRASARNVTTYQYLGVTYRVKRDRIIIGERTVAHFKECDSGFLVIPYRDVFWMPYNKAAVVHNLGWWCQAYIADLIALCPIVADDDCDFYKSLRRGQDDPLGEFSTEYILTGEKHG